jgi:hypothetical protein
MTSRPATAGRTAVRGATQIQDLGAQPLHRPDGLTNVALIPGQDATTEPLPSMRKPAPSQPGAYLSARRLGGKQIEQVLPDAAGLRR